MSHTGYTLLSKLTGFLPYPCVSYASTSSSNMQSGRVNHDIEPKRVLGSRGQERLLKIVGEGSTLARIATNYEKPRYSVGDLSLVNKII